MDGEDAVSADATRTAPDWETLAQSLRSISRLQFPTKWLAEHGIDPDKAIVINVTGDGMEPTLCDGDQILVDRQRTTLVDNGIFAVSTTQGLVVRRARRSRRGWKLVRDKRGRPSMDMPEDAVVIGEVKWAARTFA